MFAHHKNRLFQKHRKIFWKFKPVLKFLAKIGTIQL